MHRKSVETTYIKIILIKIAEAALQVSFYFMSLVSIVIFYSDK